MDKSVKITVIVSAAIIISAISAMVIMLIPKESEQTNISSYLGAKKVFWLFNSEIPNLNETQMGMPHDVYSLPIITVFKGDTVTIHFFNTEEPGGDHHSFTMTQPYNINIVLAPRENRTITFVANTTGIFTYYCTFHQPTMSGQLVVQPPPSGSE